MIRPLLCLTLLTLSALPVMAQAPDPASLEKQVKKLHAAAGGTYCQNLDELTDPESLVSWSFDYLPIWAESEDETESVVLFRVFCASGAYNMEHSYYWWREYEGLQPLAFAQPVYDLDYAEEGNNESEVLGVTVAGMAGVTSLINSDFDPETMKVTSTSFWRGVGDASSSATWILDSGQFSLLQFQVDASYDGEINPKTILDYSEHYQGE